MDELHAARGEQERIEAQIDMFLTRARRSVSELPADELTVPPEMNAAHEAAILGVEKAAEQLRLRNRQLFQLKMQEARCQLPDDSAGVDR